MLAHYFFVDNEFVITVPHNFNDVSNNEMYTTRVPQNWDDGHVQL